MDWQPKKFWLSSFSMIFLLFSLNLTASKMFEKQSAVKKVVASSHVSLNLPSNVWGKTGQELSVPITLGTDQAGITRIDIALNFDPKIIEIVNLDSKPSLLSLCSFGLCQNFSESTLPLLLSQANEIGSLKFSIKASKENNFRKISEFENLLATLTLKSKISGKNTRKRAIVSFDFTPGSLQDSNVIQLSENKEADLLTEVNNLILMLSPK